MTKKDDQSENAQPAVGEPQQGREQPATAEQPPPLDQLQQQLDTAGEKYQEIHQRWLRCQADFDNFRKRQQRQLEDVKKYGNQSLLCDLLEPLDNFERALGVLQDTQADLAAVRTGIGLVASQLLGLLSGKWGLKKIDSLQQTYDASQHHAVSFQESRDYQQETVIEEFQSGYLLHDRVIRPAMVKVGRPLTAKGLEIDGAQSPGD